MYILYRYVPWTLLEHVKMTLLHLRSFFLQCAGFFSRVMRLFREKC